MPNDDQCKLAEVDVNNMTRKELEALPCRAWDEDVGTFDWLVILPTRRKHDSGYRCIDFVAGRGTSPVCRLSGCSDALHIEGIGGYGDNWPEIYGAVPSLVPPRGWMVDCLPRSGLLRLFCGSHGMKAGPALSSFEIFSVKRDGAKQGE